VRLLAGTLAVPDFAAMDVDADGDGAMLQAIEQCINEVFLLEQLAPFGRIKGRRDNCRCAVVG
jgi:hypothetical protein